MVYPALLPLMRTPRLPVVDWTDAFADLNGLVRFAREMKSDFCACAIAFQLAPTTREATSCLPWADVEPTSECEDVNWYITPTDQFTEIKSLRLTRWIIAMYEEADIILLRINHWHRWYCKYSFFNRTNKRWSQIPAGLLAHFLCKPNLFTYLLTYLLTYSLTPWCRVLLEKLTSLQLVKKFPVFQGTRKFITALTRVRHLSLSWASPIQSIYPHPTSNIIHPSTPRSPQWSLSLRFPHQDTIHTTLLTHTRHMPSPSHSSPFYHPHNIGWAVQII